MNKSLDAMLIEAAHATGPLTNSYRIIDYMKNRKFYNIPMPGHVSRRIQQLGIARPTGRKIQFDRARSSTINEYEVPR
ncbi:MAG: hypothetical protein A4E31_00120 [Methanomassiliicoccales archaeon PtaU1.Bin030]|nr:MAG: hypothetical protein A4E31_00120 [Methanomassiliicoccales archaeon PtaU1.Bin030]